MTDFNSMKFNALETREEAGEYISRVVEKRLDELPAGEVVVRVLFSSVNYKDALSLSGNKGVTRQYPHTAGIDAAGVVFSSEDPRFNAGDAVIVTSYDLGMNTAGAYAEYIRVPSAWVVPMPAAMDAEYAMRLGTAGLTAALSVDKLVRADVKPDDGEILVTGATGGVGSLAVMLLSHLGYQVVAGTGKADKIVYLQDLGAQAVVMREDLQAGVERAMLKPRWAGVIDSVGGDILFNAIKSCQPNGVVTACGLVAGAEFSANVFPFILRGVSLLGVDSAQADGQTRQRIWRLLANKWRLENLKRLGDTIGLAAVPACARTLLSGEHQGRTLVKVSD